VHCTAGLLEEGSHHDRHSRRGGTRQGTALLLLQRFAAWLAAADVCLALTTYQAGRLFFIGRRDDGGIRGHERMIEQCQGLWTDGQSLWTSALYMLWRFENVLAAGETTPQGADRKFVPREGRVTGRTDIHDIGMGEVDGERAPVFVNTLFSCLATVSDKASFRPLWRPSFISALAPEDRCHLNGLAMDDARPAYVSAVSRSDVADGWRERRRDGGVVSTWRAASSWRAACRCRTRRGFTTAGCGCSTPAPASSAPSIVRAARSRRSRSAPAMRAGSPSPADTR
jgi:hypothetical protein